MLIEELINAINGRILAAGADIRGRSIENVYICDLLSWVLSHASKGDAWITVLTNVNVPAVAMLTGVACVIIPENIEVEKYTLEKAEENGITIIGSRYNSFEICKKVIEKLGRNKA
jgi:predicted transcriptional regulator